jgi:hypothetical protein
MMRCNADHDYYLSSPLWIIIVVIVVQGVTKCIVCTQSSSKAVNASRPPYYGINSLTAHYHLPKGNILILCM